MGQEGAAGARRVLGGEFYPTEVYTLDTYVDAPQRGLWSLIGEAVQSAFAVVADFFNTVVQQIQAGAGWLVGIVARPATAWRTAAFA